MAIATDPIRKVAILVSALDQRSADAVLEQIGDQQAALVRNAILEMDDVPSNEQERVIAEFMQQRDLSPDSAGQGVEIDASLQTLFQPTTERLTAEEERMEGEDRPFRFIHSAKTDTVADYLENEHPQVVAIVLSHLPPQRAGDVLAQFSSDTQAEILTRIARLQDADPNIVREVEDGLKNGLSERIRQDSQRAAGVSAVQAILESRQDIARSELLGSVAMLDPQLANQLGNQTDTPFPSAQEEVEEPPTEWTNPLELQRKRSKGMIPEQPESEPIPPVAASPPVQPSPTIRVTFDDFSSFDDTAVAMIFERAEPHIAFLALAGAPVALVSRIMNQLTPRDARDLRQRIENIGPVRLLDVELAQRNVAEQAAQLIEEGKLTLPYRKLSIAA